VGCVLQALASGLPLASRRPIVWVPILAMAGYWLCCFLSILGWSLDLVGPIVGRVD
jgi:hypothetical protein